MASAASLKIFCSRGDSPPRNSKTNNAGIKVGGSIPLIPPGVGAYDHYAAQKIQTKIQTITHIKTSRKLRRAKDFMGSPLYFYCEKGRRESVTYA
jgi:hypothetical protein